MASFLSNLFSGGAEREAAQRNRGLLADYQTKGTGYLDQGLNNSTGAIDQGYNTALGYLDRAYLPLANLGSKYGAATGLYQDALGVNGADAARAAQQAYTTSPGYQAGIDAGIDVLNRRRAIGGMLDSGNADLDALTFGQNAQNKEYGSWLDRLGGFVSPEMQATSGASNVLGQQAGLATGRGTTLANLYNQDAQNRVNLQGSVTSGGISANNQQAAGEAAGARNLLNAGVSLASLAAGGGFGFGGGGLGSMLGGGGSLFGNGTGFATNPWSSGGMFGRG